LLQLLLRNINHAFPLCDHGYQAFALAWFQDADSPGADARAQTASAAT
jgi:hypothetical protein